MPVNNVAIAFPDVNSASKPLEFASLRMSFKYKSFLLHAFPAGHAVTKVNLASKQLFFVHAKAQDFAACVDLNITDQVNPFIKFLLPNTAIRGLTYIFDFDPFDVIPKQCSNMKRILEPKVKEFKVFVHQQQRIRNETLKMLRKGVKRTRRPFDFFSSAYQKALRQSLASANAKPNFTEIVRLTRAKWATLGDEERLPYLQMAKEDKLRYQTDIAEFKKTYMEPPRKPPSAHILYTREHKDDTLPVLWKSLDSNVKQEYLDKAQRNFEEFEKAMTDFKNWCSEHNITTKEALEAWKLK